MIRFLHSTASDKVLKAAREKGGAVKRRKTFITAKQLLRDKNVRFGPTFPATLCFAWKGRNRKFDVATEAVKFIKQQVENELWNIRQHKETDVWWVFFLPFFVCFMDLDLTRRESSASCWRAFCVHVFSSALERRFLLTRLVHVGSF